MKNISLLIMLLAIVSFSSCRKNRTCNCITTNSGVINEPTTKDIIMENVNKEEGTTECDTYDSEHTQQGLVKTVECSLVL